MRILLSIIVFCLLTVQSNAAGQSYRLQSGDKISVSVWQDQKLDRHVVVRPDGKISFPLAGHMSAAGLSLEALERKLKSRLSKFYNEDLNVTVMLTAPDAQGQRVVYVTGEVRKPGPFYIKKPTTVLQALAMSGGLGPYAAKGRIQVRRKIRGRDVFLSFDYNAVESGGDLTGNIYLRDGDVVVVPERGLFE